jgi:phosphatidylserine/phosphatidylglycerophosphate/cardiolipin synthase-like enzyme
MSFRARIFHATSRLACLITLACALGLAAAPVPAAHAASFSPARTVFNNPNGTREQRYRIVSYVDRAIDSAPKGSVIRIAMYSIYSRTTTDKLLAADRRGVTVQIITDDHYTSPQMHELTSSLGRRVTTGTGSFVKVCHLSCSSNEPSSYMHAKFFLFSRAGSYRRVSLVTSANLSVTQVDTGWNNMLTLVNNVAVYDTIRRYFVQMTSDATSPSTAYHQASEANVRVYTFPRWHGKILDPSTDTYYAVLNSITCAGAASGYGRNGKTVIHVASYEFTSFRLYLAKKLWDLDNAGCDVSMVYSAENTDARVTAALKKPGGRHGGIRMRNADRDTNHDGVKDKYSHNKYFMVNGVYNGNHRAKVVFTGSANFTRVGLRYNNEVNLKVMSAAVYNAYYRNFHQLYVYPPTTLSSARTIMPNVQPKVKPLAQSAAD